MKLRKFIYTIIKVYYSLKLFVFLLPFVFGNKNVIAQSIYGCTSIIALNYDAEATDDDGSCIYSLSDSIPLTIFSDFDTIFGSTDDEELFAGFSIHNTSDSDLVVYVQRNILTENSPENWFCWGLCYFPSTNQSHYGVEIEPGSYSNDFSAYLIPENYGGFYDIEYCFYTESDYSNRVCKTIHYEVDGVIPGCNDVNALNYNHLANTNDSSCVLYPTPDWDFSFAGNASHMILLTSEIDINIEGKPISNGDWIGVFYEVEEGFVCAGYVEWEGQNTTIHVSGSVNLLGDSLPYNTNFKWQVWDASQGISWPMEVVYNQNFENQGFFVENGQSALLSMDNINPITSQRIHFIEGWSIFSSYIISEDMDIMNMFDPIKDSLIIIKDNSGQAYLVEFEFNAIGDLEAGQGYFIKTSDECSLDFLGAFSKPELNPISLQHGWNTVGYLRPNAESADVIFNSLVNQGFIQLIKNYSGSVYIPEWNFNGIGFMEPGHGYQVKTFQECILQY